MIISHLHSLLRYDYWANGLMIDAFLASGVEDEQSQIWLNHIVNAQILWHDRVARQDSGRTTWQVVPWQQLKTDYEQVHQAWSQTLTERPEATLSSILPYHNSRGEAYESSFLDILTHVVNHGTHHRSQVAARLREAGVVPPATDYIFWRRGS
ncbi:MAG: DinB family protein [Bacteroidia bacterium]|nr:DinB family protein [Bacteroidia bacterium]